MGRVAISGLAKSQTQALRKRQITPDSSEAVNKEEDFTTWTKLATEQGWGGASAGPLKGPHPCSALNVVLEGRQGSTPRGGWRLTQQRDPGLSLSSGKLTESQGSPEATAEEKVLQESGLGGQTGQVTS